MSPTPFGPIPDRQRPRFVALVVVLGLLLALGHAGAQALPASTEGEPLQAAQGRTVAFTAREFVRNGRFNIKWDDWAWANILTVSFTDVGHSSDPVLVLQGSSDTYDPNTDAYWNWVRQEIFLPTTISASTFSVDYRLAADTYPQAGGLLAARLVSVDATNQPTLVAEWQVTGDQAVTQDTGWQTFQTTLTADQVQKLQQSHQAGHHVYLVFLLGMGDPTAFDLYLDNVSLKLDGQWVYPNVGGAIAFVSVDAQGNRTVNWIRPDGSGRQTVWTYPAAAPIKKLFNLAWKPDGTEIAFASGHEFGYSNFQTDIYAVRVSDGRVRRLTNPPAHSEIQAGSYGKGTVTGKIQNNFGAVSTFLVYIQGADQPLALAPGGSGTVTPFTIPNVADLGTGVNQYMAFIWSGQVDTNSDGIPDKNCATSITPAAGTLIDVRAGQTIDIGTVHFNGSHSCPQWEAAEPAWKPDGSKVGFVIDGVPAAVDMGGNLDTNLFSPGTPLYRFDWTPRGDCPLAYVATAGIFCTSEGGGQGTQVVNPGASPYVNPTDMDPLPDGSGFIFVNGLDIYRYSFADNKITQIVDFDLYRPELPVLTDPLSRIRVGPNGRYAVFERSSPDLPGGRDLWLIDLTRPTDLWPLSEDGKAFYPDWLHGEPQTSGPTPTPTPMPTATPTPPPGPTATPTPSGSPSPTPRAQIYLPQVVR